MFVRLTMRRFFLFVLLGVALEFAAVAAILYVVHDDLGTTDGPPSGSRRTSPDNTAPSV